MMLVAMTMIMPAAAIGTMVVWLMVVMGVRVVSVFVIMRMMVMTVVVAAAGTVHMPVIVRGLRG